MYLMRCDPCCALLQVLTDGQGVYYAVDGVKPQKPVAYRYLELGLCLKLCGLGSIGSCQVSCRWTQAVVAHSPHAKDYKQFLRSPRSIGEVPIILPPWEQDEVLDLRQVVYPEMSTEQVCEQHLLLHIVLQVSFATTFSSMSTCRPLSVWPDAMAFQEPYFMIPRTKGFCRPWHRSPSMF